MRYVKIATIVGLLLGCGACGSSQPTPRPIDQASRFIQALNAKDTGRMAEVSGIPFRFRNQAWESAPDGAGFVLGSADERVAADSAQLDPLLRDLASMDMGTLTNKLNAAKAGTIDAYLTKFGLHRPLLNHAESPEPWHVEATSP